MTQLDIRKPATLPICFHHDANHVRLRVSLDLTGATVVFRYKPPGAAEKTITPTLQAPVLGKTQMDIDLPDADLAATNEGRKGSYLLEVMMPGDVDPIHLIAGPYWRKPWV